MANDDEQLATASGRDDDVGRKHDDARSLLFIEQGERLGGEALCLGIWIGQGQVERLAGSVGHAGFLQRAESHRRGGRGDCERREGDKPPHGCEQVATVRSV